MLCKTTRDLILDCSLNRIDLCFIAELWVNREDDVTELSVLKDFRYKINVVDRKNRIGGGVSLIYRSTIEVICEEKGEHELFEYAQWRMRLGSQQLILMGVYRAPFSTAHPVTVSKFLDECPESYSTWQAHYKEILLIGYININMLDSDSWESTAYGDYIDTFGLVQVVKKPMHESVSCIDHMICKQDSPIMLGVVKQDWKISDHYVMYTEQKVEKPRIERMVVRFRKLHHVDHDKLSDDLQFIVDRSHDVVESGLADYYNVELVRFINKHAPVVEKSINKRNKPSGLLRNLLNLRKIKETGEEIQMYWRSE